MDVVIDELIIEDDREEHIAKHSVAIDEVHEIVEGNYAYIPSRDECYLLIGKTKQNRYLTVVIGIRNKVNTYGLVTARPSREEEKSFYEEFIKQIAGKLK